MALMLVAPVKGSSQTLRCLTPPLPCHVYVGLDYTYCSKFYVAYGVPTRACYRYTGLRFHNNVLRWRVNPKAHSH